MRIDDLLIKLEGPMSREWQEAHDGCHDFEVKRHRLEDEFVKLGNELSQFARRELALIAQKRLGGRVWCSVELQSPGYILQHGGPVAVRKPYLQFNINLGGNSYLRYNHWPESRSDIESVCVRLSEAVAVLKRKTSSPRTPC